MRDTSEYVDHWHKVLTEDEAFRTDIVASVREETINHYLAKHHEYDNDKYRYLLKKTFVVNDNEREFSVTIEAATPIVLYLPPFGEVPNADEAAAIEELFTESSGWTTLDTPDPGPSLHAPNVRILCRQLKFTIRWPKLKGDGHWTWIPAPITVVGEAYISLISDSGRHFFQITPTRFKFDKVEKFIVSDMLRDFLEAADEEGHTLLEQEIEKFNDLLVITLNIVSNKYLPQFVQTVEIPAFTIQQRPILPCFIDLSKKILTVGAGIDRVELRKTMNKSLQEGMFKLQAALQEDIETSGGILQLVTKSGEMMTDVIEELVFLNTDEILKKLERTRTLLAALDKRNVLSDALAIRSKPAVPEGIALGVNEYLLDTLAYEAMPQPTHDCTDWLDLAGARGRICYWVRIFSPDVKIAGTNVSGDVNVDVGGAIEGCIRKFWDCSWHWSCSELALAVVGRPGIQLELVESNRGIEFHARLIGTLSLGTNLPWPFDKIVKALGDIVWLATRTLINITVADIRWQFIPPDVSVPDQNTKLHLSDFKPFGFERQQGAALTNKTRFIAYAVGVTAKT